MKNTTQTGNAAESRVAQDLSGQGYEIIERNWKTKFAEIDIVAKKDGTMYFAEVKYRSNNYAGDGFDSITPRKLHHMTRAAEAWVREHDWRGPYELLAVSVMGSDIDIRQIA